jgi:hypothetical protein
MTANEARTLQLPLRVLGQGERRAELWLDHEAGEPTRLIRQSRVVNLDEPLSVHLPKAGGFVARLAPIPDQENP